jgi:hypothetical protein
MGWKVSMIIIQNPNGFNNDQLLLQTIGFENMQYVQDTTLESAIHPCDESINIGYFNNNIIICDDGQLVFEFFSRNLSALERDLIALFPGQEILAVMCHSVVNLHVYALVSNEQKLRYKGIAAEQPKDEFGKWLDEEKAIYANAILKEDGSYVWMYDEDEMAEDLMMEEFTFKVAKRLLGVEISTNEDEELMFNTVFRKYQ